MKIVVIGNGKLGYAVAEKLAEDGHSLVVIDNDEKALSTTLNHIDVSGILGSGVDREVLEEAGVSEAQAAVVVTQSDEVNIISSIMAQKLGVAHTIARIREIEYAKTMDLLRPEMGSGINVNPELETAEEISRIFRFPSALKIDFFSRGRIEIIEINVTESSSLAGMQLSHLSVKGKAKVLICMVQRGDTVLIPDGEFVIQPGDHISITGTPRDINMFFKTIGYTNRKVKNVMIVGGGRIGYYLARILLESGMDVKLLEQDDVRCQRLSQLLPRATVVHCDGTEQESLLEEGIEGMDGLAALTGIDEENVIVSMFAQSRGVSKVVTKINHITFGEILEKTGIDCVVTPHVITTHNICRYIRALENSEDSSFESLISLAGGRAEAIEFHVGPGFAGNRIPLKNLRLKKNILIGIISRGSKTLYPTGEDCIYPGDNIVVVTTRSGIHEISDILG